MAFLLIATGFSIASTHAAVESKVVAQGPLRSCVTGWHARHIRIENSILAQRSCRGNALPVEHVSAAYPSGALLVAARHFSAQVSRTALAASGRRSLRVNALPPAAGLPWRHAAQAASRAALRQTSAITMCEHVDESAASPLCIVRQLEESSLTISLGARTLQRPCDEPLEKSLFRLRKAFAKPRSGKASDSGRGGKNGAKSAGKRGGSNGNRDADGEVVALLDGSGVPLSADMSASEAWSSAASVRLGERVLSVVYEPAEVTAVVVTQAPQLGLPLLPTLETRNCAAAEVEVTWLRRQMAATTTEQALTIAQTHSEQTPRMQAGEQAHSPSGALEEGQDKRGGGSGRRGDAQEESGWHVVSRSMGYTPVEADLGFTLMVLAAPLAVSRTLLAAGAATADFKPHDAPLFCALLEIGQVTSPPPRPVLAARLAEFKRRQPFCREKLERIGFRVVSYNLLADAFRRHWDDPGSVHSYCEAALTHASCRMPRLLAEVSALDADVVCIQEMDAIWMQTLWRPQMGAAGFESIFARKRSAGSSEGVAMFVRSSCFEIVQVKEIALNSETVHPGVRPLLAAHGDTAAGLAALPTVALLALLRHKHTGRTLIAANTHLYFANPAVHVRLIQTATVLHHANEWADEIAQARSKLGDPMYGLANCEAQSAKKGQQETGVESDSQSGTFGASDNSCRAARSGALARSDGLRPPLLFVGDLNSDSTDAVLSLLLEGQVEASHADWLHGALHWANSLALEREARASAEANVRNLRRDCKGEAESANGEIKANETSDGQGVGEVVRLACTDQDALAAEQPAQQRGPCAGSTLALSQVQEIARRFHLLRKSARLVAARLSEGEHFRTAADVETRACADLELGRSALDSMALAALELASQLRVPLEAVVRDTELRAVEQLLMARRDELEAEAAALRRACERAVDALLSQAETTVERGVDGGRDVGLYGDDQRSQISRRPQLASRLSEAAPDQEKTAEVATDSVAARFAGVRLTSHTLLRSAYGVHMQPTHALPAYCNTLDWICFDGAAMDVAATAPLPTREQLYQTGGMPSAEFPSDHVSLACDLIWRDITNKAEKR